MSSDLFIRVVGRVGLMKERQTRKGRPMLSLRVATRDGIWVEGLVMSEQLIEAVRSIPVGEKVVFTGTPFSDAYINKANEAVSQLKVWVDNLTEADDVYQ